jgi:glycosyltransferase involved in cell wall biosynthesis
MRAARVSILLPVWNASATIDAAVQSIRRQTESRWECIVVDDGSDDATAPLLEACGREDGRFRIITTPHQGLITALNTGLRHCSAPLIARMDADDVMHRRRLERQMTMLERDPALSAVGCHVRIFPRRGMTKRLVEYEAWLNSLSTAEDVARDAFVECPVAHPTLMMRRDMASLRYQDHDWPEDYDLVLRALVTGLRIGVVPEPLLAWRDRPRSASRTEPRYSVEQFTRCKARYLARSHLGDVSSYVLWGYGDTGRELRKALALHQKHPSYIIEVKQSRIGQRIHGAPVIEPHELAGIRGCRIVVSVARAGPRAEIRAALAGMQFMEGVDYVCAA